MRTVAAMMLVSCLALAPASFAGTEAGNSGSEVNTGAVKPWQKFRFTHYPFTAEELWQKILKVAARPDGYITHAEAEHIFGVTLPEYDPDPQKPKEHTYLVSRDRSEWYVTLMVMESGTAESSFYFSWGSWNSDVPVVAPVGMCISTASAVSSLNALGWKFSRRKVARLSPFTGKPYRVKHEKFWFRKDSRGKLGVGFKGDCLTGLEISSEARPDEYFYDYDGFW